MTKKKLGRFFDDIDLGKEVKFTEEEFDIFENFEWAILYDNGLKNINGGYSSLIVYDEENDYDDEDKEISYLLCEAECGTQDCGGGHSSNDKWTLKYDRSNKKFI